jgi:hypothetical protein
MSKGLKPCTKANFDFFVARQKKPLQKQVMTAGDPPSVRYFDHRGREVARAYVAWVGTPAEYLIRH